MTPGVYHYTTLQWQFSKFTTPAHHYIPKSDIHSECGFVTKYFNAILNKPSILNKSHFGTSGNLYVNLTGQQ